MTTKLIQELVGLADNTPSHFDGMISVDHLDAICIIRVQVMYALADIDFSLNVKEHDAIGLQSAIDKIKEL